MSIQKRRQRIRAKVSGTNKVPRLLAVKSNKHIAAQLINDDKGETLVSVSDQELKSKTKITKSKMAFEVGKLIAEKIKNLPAGRQVEKVVFDRAGYKYHGRIKALAEGAREGGLIF